MERGEERVEKRGKGKGTGKGPLLWILDTLLTHARAPDIRGLSKKYQCTADLKQFSCVGATGYIGSPTVQ